MEAVFEVGDHARKELAHHGQRLRDALRGDHPGLTEHLGRCEQLDAAGVLGQHLLEHGTIQPRDVQAQIGQIELRLQVKQGCEVADAGLEVQERTFLLLLGQHHGHVDRQRAGTASPAGSQQRQQPPGWRVRFLLDLQSGQDRLQSSVEGAENELGLDRLSRSQNKAGHFLAQSTHHFQPAFRIRRKRDDHHLGLQLEDGLVGVFEGGSGRTLAVHVGPENAPQLAGDRVHYVRTDDQRAHRAFQEAVGGKGGASLRFS